MAQGWAGFSEEELRRLKQNQDPFEPQRRLAVKKSRQQLQREKSLVDQSQKVGLRDWSTTSPSEQLLSAPKQGCTYQKAHSSFRSASPAGSAKHLCIESSPQEPGLENYQNYHVEVLPPKLNCKLEKKKMELQEKSRWEVLQEGQRLIEEKNKRKKALLTQAIAERSKRTQAETIKLKRIQKELQALDDMVSADIGILRNRIDQASLDYSYALKRFDRAEAEYVTAKLDLQRKTEAKEQLTEHLCTIIQQNELRKAKKLEELMQQLDVQADEEALDLEVELERLLHQQETESGKQVVPPKGLCQPAEESVSLGCDDETKKSEAQAAPPEEDNQGEPCSSTLALDCQNQGAKNFPTAVDSDECYPGL